jgi:hypothetical protein
MRDLKRGRITPGILTAVIVTILVGAAGTYFLARSNAQSLKPAVQAPAGLLHPVSLRIAPYQYVAYSGSLAQAQKDTGIKQFFAAFVISDGTCKPAWGGATTGGLGSPRALDIMNDITALRSQGGDVGISFGGANGTELATVCPTEPELTAAYQQVIDAYQLKRIDFDVEGATLRNQASNQRRAAAIANIQKSNPNIQVWLTLPVHVKGLTPDGQTVLQQLINHKVKLSGINIMAMNYNIGSKDMGAQAVDSTKKTVGQLSRLFPDDSAQAIWKALTITVMAGHNTTPGEVFTLHDAKVVHDFAEDNGVGTLSLWNLSRDVQCPDPNTPQPSVSCSGVQQKPYDFTKALTIQAKQ